MRKSSGPSTDPCGIPSGISFQEELRPSRNTFWFWLFKQFSKSIINFPTSPYVFNVKISPS